MVQLNLILFTLFIKTIQKYWWKKSVQLNYILFRNISMNIDSSRQNQSSNGKFEFHLQCIHFEVQF